MWAYEPADPVGSVPFLCQLLIFVHEAVLIQKYKWDLLKGVQLAMFVGNAVVVAVAFKLLHLGTTWAEVASRSSHYWMNLHKTVYGALVLEIMVAWLPFQV